jgi:hypothetical protein
MQTKPVVVLRSLRFKNPLEFIPSLSLRNLMNSTGSGSTGCALRYLKHFYFLLLE